MLHKSTKYFTPESPTVSLKSLEAELAGYYGALSILLEECYMPGAGLRMLGLDQEKARGLLVEHIDVRATRIGKRLPVWFKYAYEGVMSSGFDMDQFSETDGPFEKLGDMLNLLPVNDGYFEDCLAGAGAYISEPSTCQLADLVKRVDARLRLDQGDVLSVSALARLAGMNERSVRNMVSADGDNRLVVGDNNLVEHLEALRWLKGRRGFTPTQFRSLPGNLKEMPDVLEAVEIPGFINFRLKALWTGVEKEGFSFGTVPTRPAWWTRAANSAGMLATRLDTVAQLPFDVKPDECTGLAKAIDVEPVWFTHQVMTALFPREVDMLLNPDAWRDDSVAVASQPALQSITVALTASMLNHGYIDLPMAAKDLFPPDCFGSRAEGDESGQVELIYGAHRAQSDIRIKSAKTISPRRRFTAWLRTELAANAGDRIRIEKTEERVYTLVYLPK